MLTASSRQTRWRPHKKAPPTFEASGAETGRHQGEIPSGLFTALSSGRHLPGTEQDQNVNVQTAVQTASIALFARIA